MTEILTVGSGSSGNCYVLKTTYNGGLCCRLIIEAGVRFKTVQAALKYDLSNICGVIVSHEHTDHAGFVKDYLKRGFSVYATKGTCEALQLSVNTVELKRKYHIGEFTIFPFKTEHDAAEPCGFLITCPDGNRIVFATDTYFLRYKFLNVSVYMIECNYEEAILQHNVKTGIVHPSVAHRVHSSHMSIQQCVETLKANDLSSVKAIILIHLSSDNSKEDRFQTLVEKATGKLVYVAKKGRNVEIF